MRIEELGSIILIHWIGRYDLKRGPVYKEWCASNGKPLPA